MEKGKEVYKDILNIYKIGDKNPDIQRLILEEIQN